LIEINANLPRGATAAGFITAINAEGAFGMERSIARKKRSLEACGSSAATLTGAIVAGVGLLVLLGWAAGINLFTSLNPGWATMKANTAFGFVLAGAALFFSTANHRDRGRGRSNAGFACSAAIGLLGMLTLFEYAFRIDLGIDQLLIRDLSTSPPAHPGRPALVTALNFFMIATALLLNRMPGKGAHWMATILACLTILDSFLATLGYIYNVSALYSLGPYSSVALHTAILFLALGAAVILSEPRRGLMLLLGSPYAGGRVARSLLPVAILLPPMLGWLALRGELSGLYAPELGMAAFTVANIVIFAALILLDVRSLDNVDSTRQQEAKFRGLLESAPEAMVIVDEAGRIAYVNALVKSLFGYGLGELTGQPSEILMPEGQRAAHLARRDEFFKYPATRPMESGLELVGRRKDGTEFPMEVSLSPLETPEGLLVSAAVRDVTARKQAAAELEHTRAKAEAANIAKSRFLAAASHDLRQPLQTIALLEGILRDMVTDPQALSIIDKLGMNLNAMTDMLDTLLEVNELEAGIVQPVIEEFAIGKLLERLRAELRYHAEAKGLTLHVVHSSAIVRSDPKLLERIIRNLLSNAMKYTQEGKILLGCRRHGTKLRIEVLDTGIGIPDDQIKIIFEEFHQVDNPARDRRRGLGLGLSIVQRLSNLLSHPVNVRSAPRKGSVFSVEVPLGKRPAAVPTNVRKPDAGVRPTQILLVEDDEAIRFSSQILLQRDGHTVVAAENAANALAHLRQTNWRPEVIVSDFNLPGGINGLELIKLIRSEFCAQVPAILLTGGISTAMQDTVGAANCMLLYKPVSSATLKAAIEQCRVDPPVALVDS
jgi:PAS domain S-box-containing protein